MNTSDLYTYGIGCAWGVHGVGMWAGLIASGSFVTLRTLCCGCSAIMLVGAASVPESGACSTIIIHMCNC